MLHVSCIQTINFSVGKWSALIKQAKKKQEGPDPPALSLHSGDIAAVSVDSGHRKGIKFDL